MAKWQNGSPWKMWAQCHKICCSTVHLNGEQEIEDQVQVHTSVTWSNVYSGAVSEFSRAALGQVRLGPPYPQVCPNLFLLWPGYKVAELGSDIHVNISPSLTEHSYEQLCPTSRIVFKRKLIQVQRLLSEIRCSNEMSGTKHFLILTGLVCIFNNQVFLDIDVQDSRCLNDPCPGVWWWECIVSDTGTHGHQQQVAFARRTILPCQSYH